MQVKAAAPLPETLPRPWVPSSLDIVGPDDVRAAHPRVLPDALERLPGVTLQNQQGNPYQPDLSLRGFSASPVTGLPQGISVFLDGVRLNEPTVEEVNFDHETGERRQLYGYAISAKRYALSNLGNPDDLRLRTRWETVLARPAAIADLPRIARKNGAARRREVRRWQTTRSG